jgi:hypothetical protein
MSSATNLSNYQYNEEDQMATSKSLYGGYTVRGKRGEDRLTMNREIHEQEALATLTRLLSPETTAPILTNILRQPDKCLVIAILPAAEGRAYCSARGRTFSTWDVGASCYIQQVLKVGLCFVHYQQRWWAPAPSPF